MRERKQPFDSWFCSFFRRICLCDGWIWNRPSWPRWYVMLCTLDSLVILIGYGLGLVMTDYVLCWVSLYASSGFLMSLWLCTSLVMSTGLSYESVVTGYWFFLDWWGCGFLNRVLLWMLFFLIAGFWYEIVRLVSSWEVVLRLFAGFLTWRFCFVDFFFVVFSLFSQVFIVPGVGLRALLITHRIWWLREEDQQAFVANRHVNLFIWMRTASEARDRLCHGFGLTSWIWTKIKPKKEDKD